MSATSDAKNLEILSPKTAKLHYKSKAIMCKNKVDGIPIRETPHSPIIKNASWGIPEAALLGWLEPLGALTMRSACCL